MNSDGFAILDQSLRLSLWVFVGVFALQLLWQVAQLRIRRSRRAAQRGVHISTGSQIRLAYRALLVALAAAGLALVALTLAPLPWVDNFVTTNSWRETPLRVTSLRPDRSSTSFSLAGEVWNQTDEPLDDVVVVVRMWGIDDKMLDELTAVPTPPSLPPNSPATFQLTYGSNLPFISGYQLAFRDAEGERIPHVNGFDVGR